MNYGQYFLQRIRRAIESHDEPSHDNVVNQPDQGDDVGSVCPSIQPHSSELEQVD